jgi:hypothetical protein
VSIDHAAHYCTMALCNICIATAKAISWVIASWDATNPPPPEPELEIYKSDPSQKPLPRNVVKHLSRAELLPQSALQCPFCELIRAALVLANVRSGREHRDFKLNNIPVSAILRNKGENSFFADPLYRSSHIYLNPIRRSKAFRGIAPKDGYHLESFAVILQPADYNKSNWYRKLEINLVAFSEPGIQALSYYEGCAIY